MGERAPPLVGGRDRDIFVLYSIPTALIMDRRLITLCYSSYHKLLGRMEEEEWYVLIVVGGVGSSLGKSSQRRKP